MARTTISNIVEDLTQFSRRKKEENANLFCEGNEHLKKLLLKLWDNGIQTYACCAGHKDEENLNNDCYMVSNNPYIYFEIKNLTEMQQQKLYNHLIMNCKKLGVVSSFQLSIDNNMGFEKHGLSIHLKYDKDCFKILNDIFEDVFNEKTIFNKLKKLLKSEQKQESLTAEELEFIDSLLLINSIEFMNYSSSVKSFSKDEKVERISLDYLSDSKPVLTVNDGIQSASCVVKNSIGNYSIEIAEGMYTQDPYQPDIFYTLDNKQAKQLNLTDLLELKKFNNDRKLNFSKDFKKKDLNRILYHINKFTVKETTI